MKRPYQLGRRRPLLAVTGAWFALAVAAGPAAAASRKAPLRVETTPPGALVSIRYTSQPTSEGARQVAGTTPLEKVLEFGKEGRLWVEAELRGYAPKAVEATPETKTVIIELERIRTKDGSEAPAYVPPTLRKIALAGPEVRVTLRRFAKEEVSADEGRRVADALAAAIRAQCAGRLEVTSLPAPAAGDEEAVHKALWRDARTAMELLDPIRLNFLAEAPSLETRSGRDAVRKLGERLGADAVLVLSGRQTVETGGMKAGKVGLLAAGTAASFAGGYGNAMSRGDSVFVYNIYIPVFSQGLLLQAALVRCSDGEVLWLNKGLWSPLAPDQPAAATAVVKELLSGLP